MTNEDEETTIQGGDEAISFLGDSDETTEDSQQGYTIALGGVTLKRVEKVVQQEQVLPAIQYVIEQNYADPIDASVISGVRETINSARGASEPYMIQLYARGDLNEPVELKASNAPEMKTTRIEPYADSNSKCPVNIFRDPEGGLEELF